MKATRCFETFWTIQPKNTASHPRRFGSSATPLSEPEISQRNIFFKIIYDLLIKVYRLWNWLSVMICHHHHHHHHHYEVLLFLVEHRTSMKSFQVLRSPAVPLTSFHDLLMLLISSFIVLRHVLFILPLLLYPWGFQSNAIFSIAPASLRNVCPILFNFLLFIRFFIDFCLVILQSSSFVILSIHFTFIIRLKHLFTNICSLLVIWLLFFQVSQVYNNTEFTFVWKIRILTTTIPRVMLCNFHSLYDIFRHGCTYPNTSITLGTSTAIGASLAIIPIWQFHCTIIVPQTVNSACRGFSQPN